MRVGVRGAASADDGAGARGGFGDYERGVCMKMIVAVDENWAIGNNNELLIRIPKDQKMFRETTTGKVVVMGRKTLDSFPGGKPLKERTNIVLSKKAREPKGEEIYFTSVEDVLEKVKEYDSDDVFIIGGDSIYKQFLPYCDTALVTKIDKAYQADSFFPNLDKDDEWEVAEEGEEEIYFDLTYHFMTYKRK